MSTSVHDTKADMYQYLTGVMNEAFKIEKQSEEEEEGLEGHSYRVALVKAYIKDNRKAILCGGGYFLLILHMIILFISYARAVVAINTAYLSGNFIYYLLFAAMPFFLWMYSTTVDYWAFHDRKLGTFRLCCAHVCLEVGCFVGRITGTLIFSFFSKLSPTETLTFSMIRSFARLSLLLCGIFTFIALFSSILKGLGSEIVEAGLLSFRLDKSVDLRPAKEKEFAYDMRVVKDLKTGVMRTIKEKDRFLHCAANGTTGTGKTSSLFTVQIESDIEQICHNLEYQKKKVQEYLHDGKIRMKAPMSDSDFNLDNFEVVDEKYGDLLTDLKFTAKLAGITAMAPNAAFSDEIYSLVKAKGLKANRLDPTLNENGKLKDGFRGFNPLYIPKGLSPIQLIIKQSQTAILFADVAQAIYDASGQSDVYFAGLNKNITTTVTMLILLTYPFMKDYEGRQPVATDIQAVLNDFSKAKQYLDVLVEHYGKRDRNGQVNPLHPDLGMYQPIYDVVKNDLLGDGQKQLFDQCRGLRNIINSFLQNPLIKNILCSQDSIDLDQALENGEITLVNYALELGTDATVFGLFFILSMINAVYRRPGGEVKKLPHFFYIDELPVLLHARLEGCFSLFRQFRVAMFVAFQSLTQFEKSNSTAFLKDVILGNCSHHFVFGRAAVQEMELYEKIGGVGFTVTHMEGERGNSIFEDNPTLMYDRRDTVEKKENITGTDIRYRDFQEVFVITVDNGHAVAAFLGKVAFLPSYRRLRKKIYSVDWSSYYTELPNAAEAETSGGTVRTVDGAVRVPVAVDSFRASGSKPAEGQILMFSPGGKTNTPAPSCPEGDSSIDQTEAPVKQDKGNVLSGDPDEEREADVDMTPADVWSVSDEDDLIAMGADPAPDHTDEKVSETPCNGFVGECDSKDFRREEEESSSGACGEVELSARISTAEDRFKAQEKRTVLQKQKSDSAVNVSEPHSEVLIEEVIESSDKEENASTPRTAAYNGKLNL